MAERKLWLAAYMDRDNDEMVVDMWDEPPKLLKSGRGFRKTGAIREMCEGELEDIFGLTHDDFEPMKVIQVATTVLGGE